MPPRNNNLLQLVNNGIQRPARPDRSIPSDNTNVETPRQYQRRQVEDQAALRTMATIEAGRQITGNPDLPPDAAINAYNRAVAISQMQPDQLNDTNKLYPAGNPWTFKDNIRRALGYYTLAERDLAARLNLARSASLFGGVMPNFGSQWAWLHPQAEYDAFRQTSLYLPNALTMGATFGSSPSLLNAAKQGWNAANVAGNTANIGRQVLNLAARTGNAARTAAATAVQGANIVKPLTLTTFGTIPVTMLGQEAANSPQTGFWPSVWDAITEHPFITGAIALPAIGWGGRWISRIAGFPKVGRWLNNSWYENRYAMKQPDGTIIYYDRPFTPSRRSGAIFGADEYTKAFDPNGHYEWTPPKPTDLFFDTNASLADNLNTANTFIGLDDAGRIKAVLNLPGNEALRTRYNGLLASAEGTALSNARTALNTARANQSKVSELVATQERLAETLPLKPTQQEFWEQSIADRSAGISSGYVSYADLQNDINTILGLTPDNPLFGRDAINKANELVQDAQRAFDTADAAYTTFSGTVTTDVNKLVTQRSNQAQDLINFENTYNSNMRQMLDNHRNNYSRWNRAAKMLTWGGVGSGVAGILHSLISGGDDNSSNSTDKPDKQSSESRTQDSISGIEQQSDTVPIPRSKGNFGGHY